MIVCCDEYLGNPLSIKRCLGIGAYFYYKNKYVNLSDNRYKVSAQQM